MNLSVTLNILLGCCAWTAFAVDVTETIHEFGQNASSGVGPKAALINGGDGFYYGTTPLGGVEGSGTVYRIRPTGADYEILHHFRFTKLDGATPHAVLLNASNGLLYGTARRGGRFGKGVIFRLDKNGGNYTIVRNFAGTDGSVPTPHLAESAGVLYGTTELGGSANSGVIFKLNLDGSGFGVLRSFLNNNTDGYSPHSGVIVGSDGVLYGTTFHGGNVMGSSGTFFKINKNGTGYAILKNFLYHSGDGNYPEARLLEASDGMLYGSTTQGGSQDFGTLFRINKNGSGYAMIKDFADPRDGRMPKSALIEGSDGFLYFTTESGAGAGSIGKISKNGSQFSVIKDFSVIAQGWYPEAGLMEGTGGALYSVTRSGGTAQAGVFYKIDKSGANFSVLKTFGGSDGVRPSSVKIGSDGLLYGTTQNGGTSGYGTVFRMQKDGGAFTTVRSFDEVDGRYPWSGVIEGSDGKLYGTTENGNITANGGCVFRVDKNGANYQILKGFGTGTDGNNPVAALIEGLDGALYGTNYFGGSFNGGTIFKLNKDGSNFTVLKHFAGPDGKYARGKLTQGPDGKLYGVTYAGGTGDVGVLFKIDPNGSNYVVMKDFASTNAASPTDLLLASDGVLYGTTANGGSNFGGIIFKINTNGTNYTLLKDLEMPTGVGPRGGLIEGADGTIIGTAGGGGASDYYGTIFKVNKDGSNFTMIHDFGTGPLQSPEKGLAQDAQGHLYGATYTGGSGDSGAIFRFVPGVSLSIASGNNQSALRGSLFGEPFKVRVLNGQGQPVSGMRVRFDLPATGATGAFQGSTVFNADTAIEETDANGFAAAPAIFTSTVLGSYQLKASIAAEASVSVNITLSNVDFAFTPTAVPENSSVGTAAGTFSPNSAVTYQLVSGTGSEGNANFSIDGAQLKTAAVLDFEKNAVLSFRVRCTLDLGGSFVDKTFTVSVLDRNDAPTISSQEVTVAENSAPGTIVATVVGSDVDAGQTLLYSILNGNTGGAFAINSATGAVTVNSSVALDFESTQSYALTLAVTDNAAIPLSATASVIVHVSNVNDLAPVLTSGLVANPNPTSVGKKVVFLIAASDADGDALTLTYDYGDGTQGTDSSHFYSVPQTYFVTAKFSDGLFSTATTTQVVVFARASPEADLDGDGLPSGLDDDDDGDGISDAMEVLALSDPLDVNKTPLTGNAPAGIRGDMPIQKLSIKLNFSKERSDSIQLLGAMPVSANYSPNGQLVVFNIGGLMRSFPVASERGSSVGKDQFRISVKTPRDATKKRTATFRLTLRGDAFAANFVDEKLTNETVLARKCVVKVIGIFDGQLLESNYPLTYSAKQGKRGSAK